MNAIYVLLGMVVIGLLIYWGLARLLKSQTGDVGELKAVRDERDRLSRELQLEREAIRDDRAEAARLAEQIKRLEKLEIDLENTQRRASEEDVRARTAENVLTERDAALRQQAARVQAVEAELNTVRAEKDRLSVENSQIAANIAHSERAIAEMKEFLEQAQTKLSGAFAELAGRAFENTTKNAAAQSKSDIETLLKPFSDRIVEFRTRVDTLYSEESRERSTLLGAVNELKTLNQDMAGRTSELTRALKGSSKVRGDWGEMMLESVLRGSGLEEGKHYDRQKSSIDDEGQRLQPDIVVKLPDERKIVVDSKVNLIAWQEAMNAENPELQQDAMRRHAVALRQHVKDLGDRNYPKSIGDSALEITVAFVPIEGALSAALGTDDALQTFAFEKRVVFASPNTLMAVLRVVDRLWTRDKIQKQAIEISDAGGKVLDALTSFLVDFELVGKRLGDASNAFNSARNRLSESTHAVIPRARKLVELGTRGKRALHTELAIDPATAIDPVTAILPPPVKDESE